MGSKRTPCRSAQASTPGKLGEKIAERLRDRVRRRPPQAQRVGLRRLRRRGHADAADTTIIDNGELVSYLYDLVRARKRRGRVDGQRPARAVLPHAGPAHDQHVLRTRQGDEADELISGRRARPVRGVVRRRAGRAGHRRLRLRRVRGVPDRERRGHLARAKRNAYRQRPGSARRDRRDRRRPGDRHRLLRQGRASRCPRAWASRTSASASSRWAAPRERGPRGGRAPGGGGRAPAAGATDAEACCRGG